MFLKGFEGWHILIIVGLLVVLFGARKLPDSARSIGQSLRIFKSEMKAAGQDGEDQHPEPPAQSQPKALEQVNTAATHGEAETNAATSAHIVGTGKTEFEGVPR
jgi:sec-independent protein translocase protein TatA